MTHSSPTLYRYADWLITVPLLIAEFYFILKAQGPVSSGLGSRLFLASLAMVAGGWMGELGMCSKAMGFVIGMVFWLYIIYETFSGEAAELAQRMHSEASKSAFATLRAIVTIGWCIYPAGYFYSYMVLDGHSQDAQNSLNVLYNLADLVNKGAFGLCVWSAAQMDMKDGHHQPLM